MCLQISAIKPWDSWNWDGDEIVHRPIIPASRTIPNTKKRYAIDIREFLTTTDNAVVSEKLGELIHSVSPSDQACFRSHARGSFDFRADTIMQSFRQLRYLHRANQTGRGPDAWLYPDETLAQGGGDCEDLAFLLAALLLAAGISPYCVRVALGSLNISLANGKRETHDHCWVMYQNEAAVWEILEPMTAVGTRSGKKGIGPAQSQVRSLEYVPHYVFNADHLWRIHSRNVDRKTGFADYCQDRKFWRAFNPAFALGVHNTIYDQALGSHLSAAALSAIKRKSLSLDANILTYDPRDHFDNGYVVEGWDLVNVRLAAFRQNNNDWESFGAATHAIGDFYAHSSYVHFAQLQNVAPNAGQAVIYDPGVALVAPPQYTALPADPSLPSFDLTSDAFSMNTNLWTGTKPQAAQQCAGKLISGRYAQKYDPVATFWEGFTSIPRALAQSSDFKNRGALPHHNEIAVDSERPDSRHKLYRANSSGPTDRNAYANQFRWRVNTAIRHIEKALLDNYQP